MVVPDRERAGRTTLEFHVLGIALENMWLPGDVDQDGVAVVNARQPAWLTLVNPLLGAFGVLLGARLHSARSSAAAD